MQRSFLVPARVAPPRPRALAEHPLDQWPAAERPTTRLLTQGAGALADSELLAVLFHGHRLPVALAGELLARFGSWHGIQRASDAEIAAIPGMTAARLAQLRAAIEIGRRLLLSAQPARPQIRSPSDAAHLMLAEMAHLDQEHLRAICLDTKNRVQKVQTVYVGSLNSSLVRVGEVFKEAIRLNSAAIIVVHNHPSGDPTPSPEDVLVTREIVSAGRLLDIDVLDHLVIGQGRFVSMRERGQGF